MWDLTIYLIGNLALAHCLVFGSDTICNNPSSPLADIVYFDLLRIAVNLTILKRVY